MSNLPYFKIETFGAVDGPGIRLVIFSQGCMYRCIYCHNPESWPINKKVSTLSVDDVIQMYYHNESFYKKGGITLSGGDPLLHLDFCIDLAKACYEKHISLALDTSGVNFTSDTQNRYAKICEYHPLWIVDVKQINPKKHKQITGIDEQREINLVKFLDQHQQKFWIRQVLLPGYTDDPEDLKKLGKFLKSLHGLEHFQILPFHNLAVSKYQDLGIKYNLAKNKIPTDDDIKKATNAIKKGYNSK